MNAAPLRTPPVALCLGGVDPSAGAGILRDALTVAELGCQPMAISLAETVQNGLSCLRIDKPALDPVQRLEALAPHLVGRWGLKLSLCALEPADFRRLGATLRHFSPTVRIWDPILAPSAGVGLHDGEDLRRMATELLPSGGWVVSPNRGEAAAFAGLPPEAIRTAAPLALATPWLEAGATAVWLKGGHADGDTVQDLWITAEGVTELARVPRLAGQRRGTGCFLSAAWLALRLRGASDLEAAERAAEHLRARWGAAFTPGFAGRPMFAPLSAGTP